MEKVRPRNRFAVICHGDLWLSNVLFRYCSADPEQQQQQKQQQQQQQQVVFPVEVKFLDFQSARFASLATDLILFLFTSVSVRKQRTICWII